MTKQFKTGDKVRVVGSPDGNHRKWNYTKGFDGLKLELTKATDPEYQEYLRLKEKFE